MAAIHKTMAELKLGDVIQVFDGPYGTATVKQITESEVIVFRPYGATSDFSYTGGVIPYTGVEEIKYPISSAIAFPFWHSVNIK